MTKLLKNKFIISIIAFFLLLAGLIMLIVIPAIEEIKIINKQVYEERLKLEKLYTKGQLKNKVQKKYNSIKNNLVFLDNLIKKEGQELEYITEIEDITNEIGINININIGKTKKIPKQEFSELEFIFNLTGQWEKIIAWIDKVENMPIYTNIKEITVETHKNTKQEKTYTTTATIKANTFWLTSKL